MSNWTSEQFEAINKENTNIIVSAGAGSGKTAVLKERVIRKLKEGINIDKLLVLTFTNAAAYEMKARIRSELLKDPNLKDQLALLDSSYITTFDSFALSIVRKYHYILNISPNVKISDSSLLNTKKEMIINDIFNELYTNKDGLFLKLIKDFCLKDDQNIKDYILKINDKLDLKYDKENYLNNYIDNHLSDIKIQDDINLFLNILKDKVSKINTSLSIISNYVNNDYYHKLYSSLSPLINASLYEEYKMGVKMPNLPKGTISIVKDEKEKIKKLCDDIKDICIYKDTEEIKKSILLTKDYIKIIIYIIKELDKRIKAYKYENDLYEFVDIANISIKIIKENKEIREELTSSFNEILVDEYQDTNDLQEEFISLISNNNLYMVGDIKQSIYRFRNANPNIFKEKYNQYKNNIDGYKIDLNKNFRSREEVIDNINLIFDNIMDESLGGIDYKSEHRLILGNLDYKKIDNQNNSLEIYNYKYDKNSKISKAESEIFIIAYDILDKINNNYKVLDNNTKTLRNVTYDDFVIIIDRSSNFELYKKIFNYLQIPLSIYKDEKINETNDILVIKSILKLILNIKNNNFNEDFKHSFMSIGRSFLFELNDKQLFSYLVNNSYIDSIIYEKCYKLALLVNNITIDKLLLLIFDEFNFISSIIRIGDVDNYLSKYDYLIENAKSLSNVGYNLDNFIDYLENYFNDDSASLVKLKNVDSKACKIMTIHKSKGLQYNICYYPSIYPKFNINDLKELFYYDNNYGLIIPYVEEGIGNTIYKTLLKDKYLREEIEEKIRLFYVALTRCREKMIVIADIEEYDYELDLDIRLNYRSFKDILLSLYNYLKPFIKDINLDNYKIESNYKISNLNYHTKIPKSKLIINNYLINIDSNIIKKSSYSRKTKTLLTKEDIESIKIGNNYHYYLKMIDFNNPIFTNIDNKYQNKIKNLLNNELFKDLNNAKIYKEYEFIYNSNNEEYHGIVDLIIETNNEFKIIDYKLKDIYKEEYILQLNGYKDYFKGLTNKEIKLYLYSIMDETYKEIS